MTDKNDSVKHWCPRRAESAHEFPGPDRWDNRASLAQGIGPCCSYCGSLNPYLFMDKIRNGWIVEPTDKSYKAYVDEPYSDEQLEHIKTDSRIWQHARQMKLDEGLTDGEATAAADEHWNKYEDPWRKGHTVAKFYYQHLDEQQRAEFIELYNAKTMLLAYPGRFYVTPYFCRNCAGDCESGECTP